MYIRSDWPWFVIQGVIAFLVIASNIKYEWTPNGYLAALIAMSAAYFATLLLGLFLALIGRALLACGVPDADEPSRQDFRFTGPARHVSNALENRPRARISYNRRNLL